MIDRLEKIVARYKELEHEIASPEVASDHKKLQEIAQERASLEGLVEKYYSYQDVMQELKNTESMLKQSLDEELKQLAEDEIENLKQKASDLEYQLKLFLLPKDPNDERDIIVENV